MAITRSTAAGDRNGKIGNTVYYTSQGRQLSRAAQNVSNWGKSARRSYAQQAWRVKWANLVNIYKQSRGWMYWAFESKKAGQSDYNKFISINVHGNIYYLTKTEAASGGCIIGDFQVTEGSLYPIELNLVSNYFRTNIKTSLSGDISSKTIANVSEDLIDNNSWLSEGMQISFISYQQYTDANNVPRVICTPYEVTLDLQSQDKWGDYLPSFCCRALDGYICTDTNVSPGAHCFVLSNTVNGKTYVSTQYLVSYQNSGLQSNYSSSAQLEAAIESYGVDDEYFLESGSEETQTTEQPTSINSISVDGNSWDGKTLGLAVPFNTSVQIAFECSMTLTQCESISVECYNGSDVNIYCTGSGGSLSISDNKATISGVTFSNSSYSTGYLWRITALINGTTLSFGATSAAALGYTYDEGDTGGRPD